jgi:hypothetical protein
MIVFKIMLRIGESKIGGRGVYTIDDIGAESKILEFRGERLTSSEGDGDYALQIGKDLYIGRSGWIDDLVNHSCEANCYIDGIYLVAMRDIVAGEELTFDYSVGNTDGWEMECGCGSDRCRGVVGAFKGIPESKREEYIRLGIVPGYVLCGT